MGFDISSLVGKCAETTYEFAGEDVFIKYDPNVLTQKRLTDADQTDAKFLDYFTELVVEWDVLDGGQPVPLDTEHLAPLPIGFLRGVFRHILSENAVGNMGKVSSAPSRRPVRKARRSPAGTGTSKPRGTSK